MTVTVQLDFLPQVIPAGPPHWVGYWCCPRCWQSQLRTMHIVPGLMFGAESNYCTGRCWDCGYWARFEHAFGSTRGHLHRKGKVVSFGVEPAQAREMEKR